MSDSVLPHRRQPTRLPRPWDSPGKTKNIQKNSMIAEIEGLDTSLKILVETGWGIEEVLIVTIY